MAQRLALVAPAARLARDLRYTLPSGHDKTILPVAPADTVGYLLRRLTDAGHAATRITRIGHTCRLVVLPNDTCGV